MRKKVEISDQVRNKPVCTAKEEDKKLKILDLSGK